MPPSSILHPPSDLSRLSGPRFGRSLASFHYIPCGETGELDNKEKKKVCEKVRRAGDQRFLRLLHEDVGHQEWIATMIEKLL